MFIAMNRFKVRIGSEADFEAVWKNRDSTLSELPGFRASGLRNVPPAARRDQ